MKFEDSKSCKKKQGGSSRGRTDSEPMEERMDLKSIMKDVELLATSNMTWKERKQLENRKAVSLGGKPQKKQRFPLSVAKAAMKNQKKREQKELEESLILGRFGMKSGGGTRKVNDKRKPEDRVLRATEGHFKDGVLNVKHLMKQGPSRESYSNTSAHAFNDFKKKDGGKKRGGKKKGSGKKRRKH